MTKPIGQEGKLKNNPKLKRGKVTVHRGNKTFQRTAYLKQINGMNEGDMTHTVVGNSGKLLNGAEPHVEYANDREKNTRMGPPVTTGFFSLQDQLKNLKRCLKSRVDEKLGAPLNKDKTFNLPGNPIPIHVGKVTPAMWAEKIRIAFADKNGGVDVDSLNKSRFWYEQVWHTFEKELGGNEGVTSPHRMLQGWIISQAGESPAGGLHNVLRSLDEVMGHTNPKKPGTTGPRIRQALSEGRVDKGLALKLSDFCDSIYGLNRRSAIGYDPRGGQPACIDRWAIRDLGYVTPVVKNALGKMGAKLKVDTASVKSNESSEEADDKSAEMENPNLTQYEHCSKMYNEFCDYVNEHPELGLGTNWKPHQIQAVGWVATQKAFGNLPEDSQDAFSANTRTIPVSQSFDKGFVADAIGPLSQFDEGHDPKDGPLPSRKISNEMFSEITRWAASACNSFVRGSGEGFNNTGGRSHTLSVMGSPESCQAIACMIGYATGQSGVMCLKPQSGQNNEIVLDVIEKDPHGQFDKKVHGELWREIQSQVRKTSEAKYEQVGGLFDEEQIDPESNERKFANLARFGNSHHVEIDGNQHAAFRIVIPHKLMASDKGRSMMDDLQKCVEDSCNTVCGKKGIAVNLKASHASIDKFSREDENGRNGYKIGMGEAGRSGLQGPLTDYLGGEFLRRFRESVERHTGRKIGSDELEKAARIVHQDWSNGGRNNNPSAQARPDKVRKVKKPVEETGSLFKSLREMVNEMKIKKSEKAISKSQKEPKAKPLVNDGVGNTKSLPDRMAKQIYAPVTRKKTKKTTRVVTLPTTVIIRKDGKSQRYHKKMVPDMKPSMVSSKPTAKPVTSLTLGIRPENLKKKADKENLRIARKKKSDVNQTEADGSAQASPSSEKKAKTSKVIEK